VNDKRPQLVGVTAKHPPLKLELAVDLHVGTTTASIFLCTSIPAIL
jgi:hypothetical protein